MWKKSKWQEPDRNEKKLGKAFKVEMTVVKRFILEWDLIPKIVNTHVTYLTHNNMLRKSTRILALPQLSIEKWSKIFQKD